MPSLPTCYSLFKESIGIDSILAPSSCCFREETFANMIRLKAVPERLLLLTASARQKRRQKQLLKMPNGRKVPTPRSPKKNLKQRRRLKQLEERLNERLPSEKKRLPWVLRTLCERTLEPRKLQLDGYKILTALFIVPVARMLSE